VDQRKTACRSSSRAPIESRTEAGKGAVMEVSNESITEESRAADSDAVCYEARH
jgi:hypothetical protein